MLEKIYRCKIQKRLHHIKISNIYGAIYSRSLSRWSKKSVDNDKIINNVIFHQIIHRYWQRSNLWCEIGNFQLLSGGHIACDRHTTWSDDRHGGARDSFINSCAFSVRICVQGRARIHIRVRALVNKYGRASENARAYYSPGFEVESIMEFI